MSVLQKINDISKCPACGAKVKTMLTEKEQRVLTDPVVVSVKPDIRGGVAIITPNGKLVIGSLAMKGTKDAVQGYPSHLSTCKYSKRKEM
jgi:hypothetical protein